MKMTLLTAIGAVIFIWLTGSGMPAKVASHFDAAGTADAFISRDSYLILMAVVVFFSTLFVGGIGKLITSLPDEAINLPNKAYWLSLERKSESLGYIARWLNLFAVGIAVFLCFVHWLVVQANNAEATQLDSGLFYLGLILVLVALIIGIYSLVRRFSTINE
ncbi:DUF1648 domain-containing protein [Alteromonas flava]|uniref:DUF1648 domain-containing protein n=1 Tax=Alteromonas flava TaxID=2048003 RepID=UPI000C2891F2|nr:DUF1648 domain-containing protein [Alteromonas flava]